MYIRPIGDNGGNFYVYPNTFYSDHMLYPDYDTLTLYNIETNYGVVANILINKMFYMKRFSFTKTFSSSNTHWLTGSLDRYEINRNLTVTNCKITLINLTIILSYIYLILILDISVDVFCPNINKTVDYKLICTLVTVSQTLDDQIYVNYGVANRWDRVNRTSGKQSITFAYIIQHIIILYI